MSTAPFDGQLLTVEDYFALGEEPPFRHAELQEGVLILNSPTLIHQRVILNLAHQLKDQLPSGSEVSFSSDVILEPEFPPTVRQPDLILTTSETVDSGQRLEAKHVLLAVEVISPGTKRVDRVLKPVEYAEAGIPPLLGHRPRSRRSASLPITWRMPSRRIRRRLLSLANSSRGSRSRSASTSTGSLAG